MVSAQEYPKHLQYHKRLFFYVPIHSGLRMSHELRSVLSCFQLIKSFLVADELQFVNTSLELAVESMLRTRFPKPVAEIPLCCAVETFLAQ